MSIEILCLDQLPIGGRIFVYGSGQMGRHLASTLHARGYTVLSGFTDSSADGKTDRLDIFDFFASQIGKRSADDAMVVASPHHREIIRILESHGWHGAFDASPLLQFQSRLDERTECDRFFRDLGFCNRTALHALYGDALRSLSPIPKWPTLDLMERLLAGGATPRYVVNVGCFDGKTGDPCYPLFAAGYPGIAMDALAADDPRVSAIARNLPNPHVAKLMGTMVSPSNILGILKSYGCPKQFSMLKIDVDGFDAALLTEILAAGYRPDLLRMEVNADIPPPVRFAVLYHPSYRPDGKYGFYGCSLSMVTAIGRQYGYEALELDFGYPENVGGVRDITLVRAELLPKIARGPVSEEMLYYAEPLAFSHFYTDLGIDPRRWRHRENRHDLLAEIWLACVTASTARHGVVLPFTLSL